MRSVLPSTVQGCEIQRDEPVRVLASATSLKSGGHTSLPLVGEEVKLRDRPDSQMPTCAWIPALRLLSGPAATRLARTNGFREAWNKVEQIRLDERERIEAEAAAERRLIENAGVAGVDESGQQLEQREFAATRESLRRLASARASLYCHRFIKDYIRHARLGAKMTACLTQFAASVWRP